VQDGNTVRWAANCSERSAKGGKTGRGLPRHEIAAQTIEDDKDSARHVSDFHIVEQE